MTKISRKELLKKPDEFITLSARAIAYTTEHLKQFKIAGIVLVGVIVIALAAGAWVKHVNVKALEAYNNAFSPIPEDMDPEKDSAALEESGKLFDEVSEKYDMSRISLLAAAESAHLNFLQKKYDEAIEGYSRFMNETKDETYKTMAATAIGVCYEKKGDYANAVSTLEKVVSGPNDYFREQAMINLARIYRLDNKPDKSNELLKEFVTTFETSSFLPVAKAMIKQ